MGTLKTFVSMATSYIWLKMVVEQTRMTKPLPLWSRNFEASSNI